jgi:hypothetical protein
VHEWLGGKALLNWVFRYEERHPETCGRKGEYPMMVFTKR